MSSDPPEPLQDDATVGEDAGESPGPSPFAPTPRGLPTTERGCSRMALVGCGLVALVLGLGVLTMILKANDLVGWSLERIRVEVERTLPDDLPSADRERLDVAFDAALELIESGALDPVAFQSLQTELLRFARRSEPPTAEDVHALIEALEAFASGSVEPPEEPHEGEPKRVALAVT